MKITASIKNSLQQNIITVETEGNQKEINIPSKPAGSGSSVNGAELLCASLATCFCNDIYREAARRKINIESVTVNVFAEFSNEGEPALSVNYAADIKSDSPPATIEDLIKHVDAIAEIHNTLRKGIAVSLLPNR